MNVAQLKTPAFLIDLAKLKANAQRMIDLAGNHQVMLRPHVKTHKTVEIARLQTGDTASGITVSTLAEARFFMNAGFKDITYAFPLIPNKLPQVADLAPSLDRLNLIVDHPDAVRAVHAFGKVRDIRFSLYLKVDTGCRRAGVNPQSDGAIQLAKDIHRSEVIDFQGILTHGGHAYLCKHSEEIKEVARQEREDMIRFAERLKENNIPCPEVSIGSTPTAMLGESFEGITEIRPGNYVFFDHFQAEIGTCSLDDCAVSVLTTVVSHYPERNRMLIDAGSLALSRDRGAYHLHEQESYGAVMGHPQLTVPSLSQEHGIIEGIGAIPFDQYPIGSMLRIIPNHACQTAALHATYHVMEGDKQVEEWTPVKGW